jgi:hypothetical protein
MAPTAMLPTPPSFPALFLTLFFLCTDWIWCPKRGQNGIKFSHRWSEWWWYSFVSPKFKQNLFISAWFGTSKLVALGRWFGENVVSWPDSEIYEHVKRCAQSEWGSLCSDIRLESFSTVSWQWNGQKALAGENFSGSFLLLLYGLFI